MTAVKAADLNDIQDRIVALNGGASVPIITAQEFKHSVALKLIVPAAAAADVSGSHVRVASGAGWTLAAGGGRLVYPIVLPLGMRITSWEIYVTKATSGTQTLTGRLYKVHEDGTITALDVGSTNNQNAPGPTFLIENVARDLIAQHSYILALDSSAAGTGDIARHAIIYYTRP